MLEAACLRNTLDYLNKSSQKRLYLKTYNRILGSNNGRDWAEISQAFANSGYELKSRILSTADYGVPQFRERLIIVGLRKDICSKISFGFPRPTHGPDSSFGLDYFSAGKGFGRYAKTTSCEWIRRKVWRFTLRNTPWIKLFFFH